MFNKKEIYPSPKSSFRFSLKSIDEMKGSCIFVLDANVLLLPFTTDGKSLEEIRAIYTALVQADRLYIPSQAIREYLDNRSTKLTELYKVLSDKSSQNFKYVCPHPLLSGMDEYLELERLENELKDALKNYRKHLQNTLNSVKEWGWNDPVSKMYHEVLSERVLDDSDIDFDAVEADLKIRNSLKIPPGYKDGGKDDNQVGDLLIWHEILKLAKEKEKDIIFVSGDSKADWWHKSDKKPIYPRFELVDEFREKTKGNSFHIVSLSKLLSIFDASEEVVTAIKTSEKEVSVSNENENDSNQISDEYNDLLDVPDVKTIANMSSNDLIEYLEENGFVLDRVRGSHHIYRNVHSGGTIGIPHTKKRLPIGLVKSIMRSVDMLCMEGN